MMMYMVQTVVLMEQVVEMFKMIYEVALLCTALNFESASTIETWTYICWTLMMCVIS
jgi:hypothetical protein